MPEHRQDGRREGNMERTHHVGTARCRPAAPAAVQRHAGRDAPPVPDAGALAADAEAQLLVERPGAAEGREVLRSPGRRQVARQVVRPPARGVGGRVWAAEEGWAVVFAGGRTDEACGAAAAAAAAATAGPRDETEDGRQEDE